MKDRIETLSGPEKICFDYMLLGYGYKHIAFNMGVALGTVSNTAHRVLKKLDVPDRLTLILKHYDLPCWMDVPVVPERRLNGKGQRNRVV